MKNAAIVIVTSIMLLTIVSCEDMMGDFLEKAPGVDVTEDTIFSSRSQVEMFLASIYEYGVHSNLGLGSPDNGAPAIANSAGTIDAGATDEAEACANWYDPQKWNNASVSPDNTDDPRFSHRFTAIRKVTVMLDRVDEVPDITKEYANQLKAESKFIRALNYFEMFKRDRLRLKDIYARMNYCPLGAGALAGTTYPLDRNYTASLLGFEGPTLNSMDSVSDRDYLIEYLAALSTIMMHLSRFSEEIIIWNSNEYGFVEIDDAYSTGSSIMPQKKNPDIAELVRGKTGRVYGALMSLLTTMKGLPLAYNKDMQEDKELTFDAIRTVENCLELFTGMLSTMKFKKDTMERSAVKGFTNATDAADYLVNHGVPFRDAHGIIGRLVLYCIDKNKSIDELGIDELRTFSDKFEPDVYDAISLKTCVEKRLTFGAPGPSMMKDVIALNRKYLEEA